MTANTMNGISLSLFNNIKKKGNYSYYIIVKWSLNSFNWGSFCGCGFGD